jgi:hypothetical protein
MTGEPIDIRRDLAMRNLLYWVQSEPVESALDTDGGGE